MSKTVGIGQPLRRLDANSKVTGAAKYAGEGGADALLHGVIVTSSIARGHVAAIDTGHASIYNGVVSILTHENFPNLPRATIPPFGQAVLPLQGTEILYEGQPLALVLAETLEAAEEAATLVDVRYVTETPRAFNSANAVLPRSGADGNDHAFVDLDIRKDEQRGSAKPAAIIDQVYVTPSRHHNMMEPSATLAEWRDGQLHIHDSTQSVSGVRNGLAALLQMPIEKIFVRCQFVGGGFGGKGSVWPHQILAPVAARLLERPVKVSLERAGCYTGTGYQPLVENHMRLEADAEGKLLSVVHDTSNITSIADDYVEFAAAGSRSLYATPSLSSATRIVRANVGSPAPMRAPHEGPGMFATESAMDELAWKLGLDPLELRLRNYAEAGVLSGKKYSSKKLREAYHEAARRFGWTARPAGVRAMKENGKLIGWGMASAIMSTFRFPAKARLRYSASGQLFIETGFQEIGSGAYTIMQQIAADYLQFPVEQMILQTGDTTRPQIAGTFGSQTTMSTGSAVANAALRLKERLTQLAGTNSLPDFSLWPLLLRTHELEEIVAEGSFDLPTGSQFDVQGGHSAFAMHSWGAIFVEMEVDEALGLARMRRCVAGYSAGRIINPRTARSQMIGGIIWGLGRALLEESRIDPRYGRYVSKNLSGVMLPVNADVPRDIDVFFADEDDREASPIGARGIGELGEVGVAAAITNAIFHATGKRIRQLPIHMDNLLA